MTSFSLFKNSFAVLLRYKNTALILIAISFVLSLITLYFDNQMNMSSLTGQFSGFGPYIISLILSVLIGAAVAVAWHRRVLLDEKLSFAPNSLIGKPVWNYILGILIIIGLVILTAIIFFIVAFALVFIVSLLGYLGAAILMIATLAAYLVMAVAFTRISIILPARAVERPISLVTAWNATKDTNGMIAGYLLLFVAVFIVLFIPVILIAVQNLNSVMIMSPFIIVYISIVSAVFTMAQLSAMTLLYAHYVKE